MLKETKLTTKEQMERYKKELLVANTQKKFASVWKKLVAEYGSDKVVVNILPVRTASFSVTDVQKLANMWSFVIDFAKDEVKRKVNAIAKASGAEAVTNKNKKWLDYLDSLVKSSTASKAAIDEAKAMLRAAKKAQSKGDVVRYPAWLGRAKTSMIRLLAYKEVVQVINECSSVASYLDKQNFDELSFVWSMFVKECGSEKVALTYLPKDVPYELQNLLDYKQKFDLCTSIKKSESDFLYAKSTSEELEACYSFAIHWFALVELSGSRQNAVEFLCVDENSSFHELEHIANEYAAFKADILKFSDPKVAGEEEGVANFDSLYTQLGKLMQNYQNTHKFLFGETEPKWFRRLLADAKMAKAEKHPNTGQVKAPTEAELEQTKQKLRKALFAFKGTVFSSLRQTGKVRRLLAIYDKLVAMFPSENDAKHFIFAGGVFSDWFKEARKFARICSLYEELCSFEADNLATYDNKQNSDKFDAVWRKFVKACGSEKKAKDMLPKQLSYPISNLLEYETKHDLCAKIYLAGDAFLGNQDKDKKSTAQKLFLEHWRALVKICTQREKAVHFLFNNQKVPEWFTNLDRITGNHLRLKQKILFLKSKSAGFSMNERVIDFAVLYTELVKQTGSRNNADEFLFAKVESSADNAERVPVLKVVRLPRWFLALRNKADNYIAAEQEKALLLAEGSDIVKSETARQKRQAAQGAKQGRRKQAAATRHLYHPNILRIRSLRELLKSKTLYDEDYEKLRAELESLVHAAKISRAQEKLPNVLRKNGAEKQRKDVIAMAKMLFKEQGHPKSIIDDIASIFDGGGSYIPKTVVQMVMDEHNKGNHLVSIKEKTLLFASQISVDIASLIAMAIMLVKEQGHPKSITDDIASIFYGGSTYIPKAVVKTVMEQHKQGYRLMAISGKTLLFAGRRSFDVTLIALNTLTCKGKKKLLTSMTDFVRNTTESFNRKCKNDGVAKRIRAAFVLDCYQDGTECKLLEVDISPKAMSAHERKKKQAA